jgi:hypothetical protein
LEAQKGEREVWKREHERLGWEMIVITTHRLDLENSALRKSCKRS